MTPKNTPENQVIGNYVEVDGEQFYRIANCQLMPEFFMIPVSSGNHWMFVSSRGALTAGRQNPDSPLFPYYSADKILDMSECTGPKTIFRIENDKEFVFWEPFSKAVNDFSTIRTVYKNVLGNRVCFEELNEQLGLRFRYQWTFGDEFGFVRSCTLTNYNPEPLRIEMLDGLENLMPVGLDRHFQMRFSNLGDAYKKNELLAESKIGVFYLSSVPTDKAEPSEGLRATVAWQHGLDNPRTLISSKQVDHFRQGGEIQEERDVRAHRGAYLLNTKFELVQGEAKEWTIVGDTGLDQAAVHDLHHELLETPDISLAVKNDVEANEKKLRSIIASTDGLQAGRQPLSTHRHQSNVLFNVMRGGFPAGGYKIKRSDFIAHVRLSNTATYRRNQAQLEDLEGELEVHELVEMLREIRDPELLRLGLEYLPFSFSRRHGDPSRPWNAFSIDLTNEDGTPKQSYQGNWRDIFQNWEALSLSFPSFTRSMVFRFVNASTADGYNPYRVTSEGLDWESPDPDDPWSNIGYWNDHQIIYLLKLLEGCRGFNPKKLNEWLAAECCVYANVPYRIRPYEEVQKDPQDTIDFDFDLEKQILELEETLGADAKLVRNAGGGIHSVALGEKLLLPALIKMTNFVPEGGIWLNTQRPEWNDANNALVGNGLSMVTVYHMRRFFRFMSDWFSALPLSDTIPVSEEVGVLLNRMLTALAENEHLLGRSLSNEQRKAIVDEFSGIGSAYRTNFYKLGMSGAKADLPLTAFVEFFELSLRFIDHTIKASRREDGLYHSYNLLELNEKEASVENLYEMLEGQVAVLNSAALTPDETVEVLEALRNSRMYREDQQSYMLYPDRELSRFIDKNFIDKKLVEDSLLYKRMIALKSPAIVRTDSKGGLHFDGDLKNVNELNQRLDQFAAKHDLVELVNEERQLWNDVYEKTFQHRGFTGRSGTFFGYEGLGSIYWHMVSKLSLAAIENLVWAADDPATEPETLKKMHELYREIREGIGVRKSPEVYGAFPIDPYSHTPAHAGVQQPGMTGQVKEDVLSRFVELGIRNKSGSLHFDLKFFETSELVAEDTEFKYVNLDGEETVVELERNSFGFTLCQVPIVYHIGDEFKVLVHRRDGGVTSRNDLSLSEQETQELYSRSRAITKIDVFFQP